MQKSSFFIFRLTFIKKFTFKKGLYLCFENNELTFTYDGLKDSCLFKFWRKTTIPSNEISTEEQDKYITRQDEVQISPYGSEHRVFTFEPR